MSDAAVGHAALCYAETAAREAATAPRLVMVDCELWLMHGDSGTKVRLTRRENGSVKVGCTNVSREAMNWITNWWASGAKEIK